MDHDIQDQPQRTFVRAKFPLILDSAEGAPAACRNDRGFDPCWPDLLVTFDYNALGILPQQGSKGPYSASIWTGFAPAFIDITDSNDPLTLINNVHLIGSWTMNVRRKYRMGSPVPTFLGMFQRYDTYGIIDTVIYGTNPDVTTIRSNTSSLLLFQLYDPSQWRIDQDMSINSFLAGLSNLGGIFTAANGIFLFVFGFGLMNILGIDRFSLLRGDKRRQGAGRNDAGASAT